MKKKLQVFVSSTYADLIEERKIVIQAILDAGHIPISVEFFSLNKNSIMDNIFQMIDSADIYLLILGNRYGTIDSNSGLSYTELEYIHAVSKNKPIFAILINNQTSHKSSPAGMYAYNHFKSVVTTQLKKTIINPVDIKPSIISLLREYSNSHLQLEESQKPYNEDVNDFIQAFYKCNPTDLSLLTNNADNNKLKYFSDIYKNFDIGSISDISANKCIVDQFGKPISDIKDIRIEVSEINDRILNELYNKPADLYQLSSRRFEELVAEIFIRKGYDVELTPATRDGGKDIYAVSKNDFGSFLYIVECKKYSPTRKVGVNVLRDLYGVLSKERATYGIAVTTSYFSKPAKDYQQDILYQMSLHDFNSIQKWLYDVT